MKTMYQMDRRTKELAEEVIQKYPETFSELEGVRIAYLSSTEKKKSHGRMVYADCQVINSKMRTICGYAFAITVYEPNMAYLDPDQQELVMWHELHHARVGGEDDYSIRPHDVNDFRDLIESKGLDYNKPHKLDEMPGQISFDDFTKAAEEKEDA